MKLSKEEIEKDMMKVGNFGRSMSEDFEFYDIILESIAMEKTEKDTINHIKMTTKNTRNTVLKATYKKPLGSELIRIIYGEENPLTLVLKSHLILELFINEIIKKKFKNSDLIINNKDFTFKIKLDILRSKNILNQNLYNDITLVNSLRNKYAHNFYYKISDFKMGKFYNLDRYDFLFKDISNKVRNELNMLLLRMVLFTLLAKITEKHPFVSDLEV